MSRFNLRSFRAGPAEPGWLALLAALFALNALLVFGDFIETPWALAPAQFSWELLGFCVLALLFARGRPLGRAARAIAAVLLLTLILMRIADIAVPWFFGRNFNIAVDLKFVPFFVDILNHALTPPMFAAALAATLAALIAGYAVLRLLLGVVFAAPPRRWVTPLAAVALLALAAHPLVPKRYDLGAAPFAGSIADVVWRNANDVLDANGLSGRYLALINQAQAARPAKADLAGLKGRNVYLVFFESYGTVTYTDPALAAGLEPVRAEFERSVRGAGYDVYSSALNSPITGGGSWMAHATLTTGVRIDSQPFYDVLLTSGLSTLGRFFRDAGYRAVVAMPRIEQPWPEGAFFSFDTVLNEEALGYRGPRFSWETTPDQFVLEKVHRMEIAPATRPLFIQYVLSSSHLPFDRVPQIVDDGAKIGDGEIYQSLDVAQYLPPAGIVFENRAGYQAAVAYTMRALENYLSQRLDDNSLVIIVGDHQPPLTIAAETHNKAVPIHVLSKDPAALEPFRKAGYAPGMIPAAMTTAIGMETFLPWLLANFSAGGG